MNKTLSVFIAAALSAGAVTAFAQAPAQTSPTKFHHSVHNAASGYWAIATGCQLASTAVSAKEFSFAVGLLEALCQCAADAGPVLLVGYDIEAVGPLASVNDSRGMLAIALVLSPTRTAQSLNAIEWAALNSPSLSKMPSPAAVEAGLSENGMADALPLVEALAQAMPAELSMPLSSGMSVRVRLHGLATRRPRQLQEAGLQ